MISMGVLWNFIAMSMGFPLDSYGYGISVIFLWYFFGMSMICLLDFYDISRGLLWDFYWIPGGFP